MRIREVGQKAENLIEQGEQIKRQQVYYQQATVNARNQLMSAYAMLDAASQTDEDGNPQGDIGYARAQIYAAQAQLASAERGMKEATQKLEFINRDKLDTLRQVEKYTEGEKKNLSKLQELQNKRFGGNANAFVADLVARMNSSEATKARLLQSMGKSGNPQTFTAGVGSSSSAHTNQGEYVPIGNAQDTNSEMNGLGSIFGGIFKGNSKFKRDSKELSKDNKVIFKKYKTIDEMPEEVWNAANDYQTNHMEKYNSIIRQNGTSDDIKKLKKIIGEHRIAEDSVFYRRASLEDLGEELKNCSLEELVGKRYQFQGIMSASNNTEMASGNVIFEIKAPAGTPALDLTDVASFQEVMFDSPLCYIEKVKPEGYNTTRIVIKVFSSKEYHDIVDELKINGVYYNPIQQFGKSRTSEEITSRISGGDMTEGSCSSLALAFLGNEAGYDVLDFRDGNSRAFFSNRESIKKIAGLPGIVSITEYGNNDIACARKLLQNVSSGKNYYLATGGHAAIVRRIDSRFEYLELQHQGNGNGWHTLDDNILVDRFGCINRCFENSNFLIDGESLSSNQEFLDILGYINTRSYEQRKGTSGSVK